MAGFAPQRSGPPRPAPALGTGRFRCYTADRVDSFVGHVPLFPRDSATRGGFPLSPWGTGEPAPRIARGAGAGGESPPKPRSPPLFNLDTHAPHLATPARPGAILAAATRPRCTRRRTRATSRGRCSTPERRRSGRDRRGRLPDSWLLSPLRYRPRLNRGRRQPGVTRRGRSEAQDARSALTRRPSRSYPTDAAHWAHRSGGSAPPTPV